MNNKSLKQEGQSGVMAVGRHSSVLINASYQTVFHFF